MIWLKYFKYLPKRAASDKLLRDRLFNFAENMMYINADLLQWLINF